MKFQKHLEWHQVPEWHDAYFNYKQLKKDLKKVKEHEPEPSRPKIDVDTVDRAEDSPARGPKLKSLFGIPEKRWDGDQAFVVVQQKSLRTYTEDEVSYETQLFGPFSDREYVQMFFKKLDSQLNMINNFYKHKEGEYISHAQELQNQLDIFFKKHDEENATFVEKNAARAMKLLRDGFMEFYKSLGFLRSYILLNRMAFGKILKKHDKVTGKSVSASYLRAVHMSYFSTSDKIIQMMDQVKSLFTDYFSRGNRKKALACLQPIRQQPYNINFVLGIFTGCSCSLLFTFSLILILPHSEKFPNVQTAFPIFSTLVLFLLHMYMYACNIFVWRKARVNYSYLFGFEHQTELKYQHVLFLSTFMTMLVTAGLVVYLVVYEISSTSTGLREAIPLGVLFVVLGLLLLPFNVCFKPARYIFLHSFLRIMFAPLFKVVLADFFLADQLTSQVTSLKNIGYSFCYYGGSYFKTHNSNHCNSRISFQYPLMVLPYWWRLMQCLRRYVDLRDTVQLANAAKYLTALITVVMKITYQWTSLKAWKFMFILSSVCGTFYQLYWDLVMDCGLLQRSSMNFLLRDKLLFRRKSVYYAFMLLDVAFRVVWMFSLFHLQLGASNSMGIELIMAAIEVFRRGIWNLFRLENEHVNNVGKFRAIKVIPLPFEDDHEVL